MSRRWFLNGLFEAGCHQNGAFSTYHAMEAGWCLWCRRSEAELVNRGALWIDVMGNKRPDLPTSQEPGGHQP